MDLQLFLKNYKAHDGKKTMDEFINKHITVKYIPYLEKYAYCESIVKSTCHTDKDIIKINRPGQLMSFLMRIIDLYTDIDIEFKNGKFVEQYDELKKVGALDALVSFIPESEYIEFSTILTMAMDDFRDNEYSIEAILYNFKTGLSLASDSFVQGLTEALEKPEIKEAIEKLRSENKDSN